MKDKEKRDLTESDLNRIDAVFSQTWTVLQEGHKFMTLCDTLIPQLKKMEKLENEGVAIPRSFVASRLYGILAVSQSTLRLLSGMVGIRGEDKEKIKSILDGMALIEESCRGIKRAIAHDLKREKKEQ